jgi:hypothetical protein
VADPTITDEMVEAYAIAAAATPCPACGRTEQCRCYVPEGREPYRIRRGLAATVPLIVEHYPRSRVGTIGVVMPDGTTTDPQVNAFFDAHGWGNFEAARAGLTGWPREAAAIRAGLDAAAALDRSSDG